MDEFALVLNSGSSSLKFAVFRAEGATDWPLAARGSIEAIGAAAKMTVRGLMRLPVQRPNVPAV